MCAKSRLSSITARKKRKELSKYKLNVPVCAVSAGREFNGKVPHLTKESAVMRMIVCIALTMALVRLAAAEPDEPYSQADLTQLPIEELMSIKVSTASKFLQNPMEAPSSVTIITAEDIKTYGYRTLADIVKSVRGMSVSNDRNYDYIGIRGIGRTGDYNSRVLLLVDGYRLNDPIYDTAPIGTEFPLDVDLIDRVEIVRGPGSSIYGSNAVLGVINVITKRAKNFNGTEASGELGSFGTDKERLSYGKQYENGAGLLLSTTRFHSRGQDLFFPEFNAINNGVAQNLDSDRYKNFYGKLNFAGFTLTGAYSKRDKAVPTASFGTLFNDPNFQVSDGESYVNLDYAGEVSQRWDVSAHLFQGRYSYDGIYPYAGAPVTLNYDQARGAWWGTEAKLIGRLNKHKVVAGVEYQNNYHQDQSSFNVAPYALLLDDKRSSTREGYYVQDEITLSEGLLLNAGLRYDYYSTVGSASNPRLGLIWNPAGTTAFKLLYGTAFRAPNVYELYYASAGSQKANPDLMPERITSYEFVIEHQPRSNLRITADVYENTINDNINQIIDPADNLLVFVNSGQVKSQGAEVEVERLWDSGVRLRANYSWQISRDVDSGTVLINSPKHRAKLNVSAPVLGNALRTGLELQYTDRRETLAGASAAGHLLTNLTLLSEKIAKGMELSASVYNLFDIRYSDPGGQEHVQDLILQDGRSYRIKMSYRF